MFRVIKDFICIFFKLYVFKSGIENDKKLIKVCTN